MAYGLLNACAGPLKVGERGDMSKKIPSDAFDYYVALGSDRSYQAVANHFGVSKRGIAKRALADQWPERLAAIEQEVRDNCDAKLAETLAQMKARHLKTLRAIQGRALSALKQFPLNSGMEAVRASEMAIKLERLIAGEASDRTELTIEEVTKQEMARWLVVESRGNSDEKVA